MSLSLALSTDSRSSSKMAGSACKTISKPNLFIHTKHTCSEYMNPVKDVDEYIALVPKEVQDKLKEFGAIIKTVALSTQERISYGMSSVFSHLSNL
jgi:hypothetical protein